MFAGTVQEGMLAPEELGDCLDTIAVHLHPADLAKIVKQMNQDQDGRISYNEFLVRSTVLIWLLFHLWPRLLCM